MHSTTARKLTEALRRYAPFSTEETRDWCAATGLDPRVVDGPVEPVNAARGTIPNDLASAVARLIQSTSVEYVRGVIDAVYFAHIRGGSGEHQPLQQRQAIPPPVVYPGGVKVYSPLPESSPPPQGHATESPPARRAKRGG